MVILPAYYAASLNADQDQVVQYFVDICEATPVRLPHSLDDITQADLKARYRSYCTTFPPTRPVKTCLQQ